MRCILVAAVASLCACTSIPKTDVVVASDNTVTRPLSAIAVSQCGMAVALFIQLDPTHLLRADPRQSDMFTSEGGQPRQSSAGPMEWTKAYELASTAPISSHVVIPCTDGPST